MRLPVSSFAMIVDRCWYCGQVYEMNRSDQSYCLKDCRQRAWRLRKRWPGWVAFIELLLGHAPFEAIGYRLSLQSGLNIFVFPPGGQVSARSVGRRSARSYFLLYPFEIPVVPTEDSYGVVYVLPSGEERTVPALYSGVEVSALVSLEGSKR